MGLSGRFGGLDLAHGPRVESPGLNRLSFDSDSDETRETENEEGFTVGTEV